MSERRKLTYSDRKSTSKRKSHLPLSTNRSSNIQQTASQSRLSTVVTRSSIASRSSSNGPRFAPSSAIRSSSATRSSRDTFGRSSSGGGLRRCGSDNYLNTPIQSTQLTPLYGRSPAIRYGHGTMPTDSSRKSKHENVLKLQEILQQDEGFYGELNLKNGGLKAMTINQFYMIIKRFVRLISGKELESFITGGDPINGILNFMEQVRYPYVVNKSILKTPNAPHTFDQVIAMLLWLSSISSVSTIAADDELFAESLKKKDDAFPNENYTAMFSKSMEEGYRLWDNQSDEHTAFIDRLTDKLIAAKLNNKVSSVVELEMLTKNLEIKSKELIDHPVRLNNIHHFEQLESKYTEYETMEHDLLNQLNEKRDRLAAINVDWTDKRAKLEMCQEKFQELATQIHQQKFKMDDYNKLGEEIKLLKSAVETIQNEINQVRDKESNQQISCARLLKKVSEAVTAFNYRSLQIVEVLNKSKSLTVSEYDLNKLHLPPNPTVQQVQKLVKILDHMFNVVKVEKNKIQIELKEVKGKLEIIKAESDRLNKEYENLQKKHEKVIFENEVMEKKATMKNKKNENCIRELTKQTDDAKHKYEMIKNEIVEAHAKIKQLEEKNVKLMEEGEAKAMEIIAEKERLCDQLDELENIIDEKLKDFDYLMK